MCFNSVYGTYLGCITLYTAANESTVKNGFMALIISALPKKSWRLPFHNAAKQFTDNIPRLHFWNTFNCLSVYFRTFIINLGLKLEAVLELPAKQHCQFSPNGPIFEVNGLDQQCYLAGTQLQTGPKNFVFFNCHRCRLLI